jgi:hypothetical protein
MCSTATKSAPVYFVAEANMQNSRIQRPTLKNRGGIVKVHINEAGTLIVEAENGLEAYALKQWTKENNLSQTVLNILINFNFDKGIKP